MPEIVHYSEGRLVTDGGQNVPDTAVTPTGTYVRGAVAAAEPASPLVGDLWSDISIADGASCLLSRTAAGNTITANTITALPLDVEEWDDASFHSGSQAYVTVPVTGEYAVSAQVEFSGGTGGDRAVFVHYGLDTSGTRLLKTLLPVAGGTTRVATATKFVRLGKGSQLCLSVFSSHTTGTCQVLASDGSGATFFQVRLMRRIFT